MLIKTKLFLLILFLSVVSTTPAKNDAKAEMVLNKAVERLGGKKYLEIKTIYSRGLFTAFREGQSGIPSSFVDVIVFGNEFKERTDFKQGGVKNIQTNVGDKGWIFDGANQTLKDQSNEDVENFKQSLRTSLDYLLRGLWRNQGTISYIGKREASLGKRNEVIKLTFKDDFSIEFEFSATDYLPMKSIYKRLNADNEEVKEEDRYAQFVEIQGIYAPFIIDHFRNNVQTSRINYNSLEFNKIIPDSIFTKPTNVKEAKKDLKF